MATTINGVPTTNSSLIADLYNVSERATSQAMFENTSVSPILNTIIPKLTSVDISTKISYVTVPVFAVIGLIGNFLTLVIMRTKHFRLSTTSVLLTALALSDTTFILVSPFTKSFMKGLFGKDPKALTETGCKAFFCIFRSAKICSSWFVILICLERFIVIWFPLHAKHISRQRTAIIAVSIVTVCVWTFDGVWTVSSGIVNGNCIPNLVTPSTKDLVAGFVVAGTAIFNIIPTCILLLFTPLSIFKLFRHVSFRREISTSGGNEDTYRVTRMLLAVTIAYIILVTPISVAHSVAFFNGDNIFTSKDPDFIVFREFAQTFEQLNYSVNFILYAVCNATFRRQFYVVIGCRRPGSREAVPRRNMVQEVPSPNISDSSSTVSTVVSQSSN